MSNYQNDLPRQPRNRAAGCLLPLLVGLVLGLTAAGAAIVVAWLAIPVNYRATAWLRIAPSKPSIMFTVGGDDELLADRKATATLVTSRFVLRAALRKPGVSQLGCLADEEDRLTWLKEHVEVSFPGDSEIMEIAVTGDDPSELVTLANAVKDAFMEEVVSVGRENHLRRSRVLDQSYNRNVEEIKKKTTQCRELARELGEDDDPEFTRARRDRELDVLTELRLQRNRAQGELRGAEARVRILKERLGRAAGKPDPAPASQAPLRDALEAAEIEQAALAATLEETNSQIAKVESNLDSMSGRSGESVELAARRAELQRLQEITEKMGQELERWEVELAAAPRASVLESASVPKSNDLRFKLRKVMAAAGAALVVGFLLGAALGAMLRRAR